MKVQFVVTLNLIDGKLDLEALEANINGLIQRGIDEGLITPDDEEHAPLVDVDIMPKGRVE